MLADVAGKIVQIRASGLGDLIRIIILQQYEKLDDFKKRYTKYGAEKLSIERIEEEWPSWNSRWIVAQAFTAMALEAFFYDYILEKESKTQADKKSNPPKRFEYINNTYFKSTDSKFIECHNELIALNKTRNHWIHNKSAELEKYKKIQYHFSPDECICLLISVFDIFSKHDKDYVVAPVTLDILLSVQQHVKSEVEGLPPYNKPLKRD
jgi:hypothetical protein